MYTTISHHNNYIPHHLKNRTPFLTWFKTYSNEIYEIFLMFQERLENLKSNVHTDSESLMLLAKYLYKKSSSNI